MKRASISSLFLLALGSAYAAPLTPGNIVVTRVGDGTAALAGIGTATFLDEYTPAGTLVQSIAIPSTGATAAVNSGTSTSELILTYNDNKFAWLGYGADAGTTGIAATTNQATDAAPVNRVVVTVDMSGTVNTATRLLGVFSGNNGRSAVVSGSNVYVAGSGGANPSLRGTLIAPLGGTSATLINSDITNVRVLNIYGGQLYMGCASGAIYHGINKFATALPTGADTIANFINTGTGGNPVSSSPYDYIFDGANTIYVCSDAATSPGVLKYTFNGATWDYQYNMFPAAGVGTRSISKLGSGYVVVGQDNKVYTFTDLGASSPFTLVATAGTNTAFRGVETVPGGSTNVTGTINLGQYTGIAAGSASVTLNYEILDSGNSVIGSGTVTGAPAGGPFSYSVASVAGMAKLRFMGGTWIQRTQSATAGSVVNFTLPNGNVHSDGNPGLEVVDIADYTDLALAFDGVEGGGNYNVNADLNKDTIIDIADYTILAMNFDATDN